jgi:hypothetical protein
MRAYKRLYALRGESFSHRSGNNLINCLREKNVYIASDESKSIRPKALILNHNFGVVAWDIENVLPGDDLLIFLTAISRQIKIHFYF